MILPHEPIRRGGGKPRATEVMVAAAFLHDVVEDTPHTLDETLAEFGSDVARLVLQGISAVGRRDR